MSPEFLITSLLIVVAPGTGVIYTLASGLSLGARASVFAALGCTLGIVPHIAASILGLAAIVHASALAFQLLKYAGVAYLLYLAWNRHSFFYFEDGNPYREQFSQHFEIQARFRTLFEMPSNTEDGPQLAILLEAVKP